MPKFRNGCLRLLKKSQAYLGSVRFLFSGIGIFWYWQSGSIPSGRDILNGERLVDDKVKKNSPHRISHCIEPVSGVLLRKGREHQLKKNTEGHNGTHYPAKGKHEVVVSEIYPLGCQYDGEYNGHGQQVVEVAEEQWNKNATQFQALIYKEE
jgi:hypothetical protein